MTISPIDNSQRIAAKVAACAYLITFATVVYVHYGILWRLTTGNAAETARNILAHEQLFRICIAGNLFFCVGIFVLLTALYVVLRPVNRALALPRGLLVARLGVHVASYYAQSLRCLAASRWR